MTIEAGKALIELGRLLLRSGYRFTTITPESHRRVNSRPDNSKSRNLRDVFGWSRPFSDKVLPARCLQLLTKAGMVERMGSLLRSKVRFSTLGAGLFVHSAYPTREADAVFLGPDTSRFEALLARTAPQCERVIDVGCGTGAGGISISGRARTIVLADINPRALQFSRVNAALQGVESRVQLVESDVLADVPGTFDLVIANPPYLVDDQRRTYRDGGGDLGIDLSRRITQEALARLLPGGRLILYTGAPIVDGEDVLRRSLQPLLAAAGARFEYWELDPDVFGEELDRKPYQKVDRIAVVALSAVMPALGPST